MKTRRRLFVVVSVLAAVSVFALQLVVSNGQERAQPIPTAPRENRIAIDPLMHVKLVQSQRVFEGLVTRKFDLIARSAEELSEISLTLPAIAPGANHDDEIFEHFRLEFLRLTGQLEKMAEAKNLEGAAYVAEKMNDTCISCHQYLRDEVKPRTSPGF